MGNPADEQAVRASEESHDTVERVTDRGKEQVASAAKAEQGGTHSEQVAKENQVLDPNAKPEKDK